eukprot:TRINITY_DN1950_c0_g1_i2.p1 TRINITY_DN1950_c0_g1~~TRINITY_DN1950_c0_g1_i2.p1  ORF type:complete len:337 (-),score=58.85 TRINITY_DN1950_c0_g1_i2:13-945(-)
MNNLEKFTNEKNTLEATIDGIKRDYITQQQLEQKFAKYTMESSGVSKEEIEKMISSFSGPSDSQIRSMIAHSLADHIKNRKELTKDDIVPWVKEVIEAIKKQDKGSWWASNSGAMSRDEVTAMIRSELDNHDADTIGLTDFALQSTGSSIDYSRTSSSYHRSEEGSFLSYMSGFLNRKKWGAPPSTVIRPEVSLGNCWAFPGSHGYVTVHLSAHIIPTSFSIDHISPKVAINMESAPKDCKVWGIDKDTGEEYLLAEYSYVNGGSTVQTFPVNMEIDKPFYLIKLEVESNYGHPEYTCLYRFRVHGKKAL